MLFRELRVFYNFLCSQPQTLNRRLKIPQRVLVGQVLGGADDHHLCPKAFPGFLGTDSPILVGRGTWSTWNRGNSRAEASPLDASTLCPHGALILGGPTLGPLKPESDPAGYRFPYIPVKSLSVHTEAQGFLLKPTVWAFCWSTSSYSHVVFSHFQMPQCRPSSILLWDYFCSFLHGVIQDVLIQR